MSDKSAHLVERAAERLRETVGLAGAAAPPRPAEPPAGRDDPIDRLADHLADHLAEREGAERPHLAEAVVAGSSGMAAAPVLDAPPPPPPAASASPAAPAIAEPARPPAERPDIPLEALQRAGLALSGERSRVAEEFRITVGRILRSIRGGTQSGSTLAIGNARAGNMLMVTSARPGEGKTFSAINLGASIAQNGLGRVLLIDLDGKPRSMTHLLELEGRPGLLDLAADTTLRLEDLVVRTAIEGLSVMPLGTKSAEGGITRAVTSAVERVGRRFSGQVVILDTAPCLSSSDPSTLAPLVDEVALVVEAERTQRSEVEAAVELIRTCPNITLVLNKVRYSSSYAFGSYYYYGGKG